MKYPWLFGSLIVLLVLVERGLVGAPDGISVSFFLLPCSFLLGLRYGRGRTDVLPLLIVLIASSELLSPLFPGLSAALSGLLALIGAQTGMILTSVRLWWAHALIGTLAIGILHSLLILISSLGRGWWTAELTFFVSLLWQGVIIAIWCFVYARQRWFHEPV